MNNQSVCCSKEFYRTVRNYGLGLIDYDMYVTPIMLRIRTIFRFSEPLYFGVLSVCTWKVLWFLASCSEVAFGLLCELVPRTWKWTCLWCSTIRKRHCHARRQANLLQTRGLVVLAKAGKDVWSTASPCVHAGWHQHYTQEDNECRGEQVLASSGHRSRWRRAGAAPP